MLFCYAVLEDFEWFISTLSEFYYFFKNLEIAGRILKKFQLDFKIYFSVNFYLFKKGYFYFIYRKDLNLQRILLSSKWKKLRSAEWLKITETQLREWNNPLIRGICTTLVRTRFKAYKSYEILDQFWKRGKKIIQTSLLQVPFSNITPN